MKKLIAMAGVAVGFIFGSRAGRGPYEQLAAKVEQVRRRKDVDDAVSVVRATVSDKIDEGMDAARATVSDVKSAADEKIGDIKDAASAKIGDIKNAADDKIGNGVSGAKNHANK